MITTLLFVLSIACSGSRGSPAPGAATPGASPPAAPTLHGDRVELALPEFSDVVASDGSPRSRDALLGQSTALWFYPAAGTPG